MSGLDKPRNVVSRANAAIAAGERETRLLRETCTEKSRALLGPGPQAIHATA